MREGACNQKINHRSCSDNSSSTSQALTTVLDLLNLEEDSFRASYYEHKAGWACWKVQVWRNLRGLFPGHLCVTCFLFPVAVGNQHVGALLPLSTLKCVTPSTLWNQQVEVETSFADFAFSLKIPCPSPSVALMALQDYLSLFTAQQQVKATFPWLWCSVLILSSVQSYVAVLLLQAV